MILRLKALICETNVLAFEPNELNFKILLRNIYENKFAAECQVVPVALSDKVGILPMCGSGTGASLVEGWAGQKNDTLVSIATFDSMGSSTVKGKTCLVLIDIEGAEFGCLKGAESLLLSDCHNVFMVEISVSEHQPKGLSINPNLIDTFELFFSCGYLAYTADNNLRKISFEEVHRIVETGDDTLGTHNFIFVKKEDKLADLGL